jgi:hypothetical protein
VAWAPYSTRFVHRSGGGGAVRTTVPAGYRAVVKHVTASSWDPAVSLVSVIVAGVLLVYHHLPVSPSTWSEELMAVAYAGEYIEGSANKNAVAWAIAGYLLREEPGQAPIQLEEVEVEPPTWLPGFQ